MILEVSKEAAIWNSLPHRFEAGTPNIAGAIGLGAAIDYLTGLGLDNIWQHEQALVKYGLEKLGKLSGVQIMGAGAGQLGSGSLGRGAIFALTLTGVHPHDIGSILNDLKIAIRAGHHCAMPLHQRYNVLASARASFYLYNTKAEIDALVSGIKKIQEIFA